jgi:hypothetical protein
MMAQALPKMIVLGSSTRFSPPNKQRQAQD